MESLETLSLWFQRYTKNTQRDSVTSFQKKTLLHFNQQLQALNKYSKALSPAQTNALMHAFILQVAIFYQAKLVPIPQESSYFSIYFYTKLIKDFLKNKQLQYVTPFIEGINDLLKTEYKNLDELIRGVSNSQSQNSYMYIFKDGFDASRSGNIEHYYAMQKVMLAFQMLIKLKADYSQKITDFSDTLKLKYNSNSYFKSHGKSVDNLQDLYESHKADMMGKSLIATADFLHECLAAYNKIYSKTKSETSIFKVGSQLKRQIRNLFKSLGIADHLTADAQSSLALFLKFEKSFNYQPKELRDYSKRLAALKQGNDKSVSEHEVPSYIG